MNKNTRPGDHWCPTCGKTTLHEKYDPKVHGKTSLLVYSGELIDGKIPVRPRIKSDEPGCPYWHGECSIHQGDRHFEVSTQFNTGQPVKRVPEDLTSTVCRPPREGEFVCVDCLDAASTGQSVMELQKEMGCPRQGIYSRADRKGIGRRYVSVDGHRPERRFTPEEVEIIKTRMKPRSKPEPPRNQKPVHCECCGTRLA